MSALRTELRGAARKRVLMKATLICASGMVEARIKDMSRSGARLGCKARVRAGEDVVFKRAAIFAPAAVVRVSATDLAVQFYKPLTISEIKSVLHNVIFVDETDDA